MTGDASWPPRRTTARARQKELTRSRLTDTALRLFVAQGYGPTTVDEITTAVGISRATFYLHFDGKARIVAEAYEERLLPETFDYYRRLDDLLAEDAGALRAWLDDALGFFERHRTLLGLADEVIAGDPLLFEHLLPAHVLERCAEAMPRYLGRWTGAEQELARLRLELLVLQLGNFARLWIDGHWPMKRETALEVLLDLWSSGLRAPYSTP